MRGLLRIGDKGDRHASLDRSEDGRMNDVVRACEHAHLDLGLGPVQNVHEALEAGWFCGGGRSWAGEVERVHMTNERCQVRWRRACAR